MHQGKILKLPKIVADHRHKHPKSQNYTSITTKEDSILKPLTKDEFKQFLKLYKKENI
jgi:hypothetical protein